MKSSVRVLVTLSLVAAINAAGAATTTAAPTLSRAEVLADLQLYREAGLYWLDTAEISSSSTAYVHARQRYEELRSSPRYVQLVEHYSAHGRERTALASR